MTKEQEGAGDLQRLDPTLQRALGDLQDQMAELDMMWEPSQGNGLELLLKKHKLLKIKMDGNRNHERPHLHLDYHRNKHMASYAIDNGDLLAGNGMYSSVVRPWIAKHHVKLTQVWDGIRGSGADPVIVAALRGSAL